MSHRPQSTAKLLIILFGACAFFAIFSVIDTAQYFRAWRSARSWTTEQKITATATDVGTMYPVIATALALDTAVIALACTGGLLLGVAVATESRRGFRAAIAACALTLASGLACALTLALYFVLLHGRLILKGPVYDYDLGLQPPVALAMAAYVVLAVAGLRAALLRGRIGDDTGAPEVARASIPTHK